MIDPGLNNKLKLIAVMLVGFAVALTAGRLIGKSDYVPIVLTALALVGTGLLFLPTQLLWVVTIASSFLAGTFPILGGSFTPFQLLMVMALGKFVVEYVVLRRTAKLHAEKIDLVLIACFMAVMTWHGIHDRFGMRFLGSTIWGGRNYVNVYVGLVAFLVLQSIPTQRTIWNKLPYFVLAVAGFDLCIGLVTQLFPSTAMKIFPFYSAIANSALREWTTGTSSEAAERIGAFGNFGNAVVLIVLASVSLRQIFHPSNFFRLFSAAVGGLMVLYSGYRTAVAQLLTATAVAGIRDLRWGILVATPIAVALLFGLSMVNSAIAPLPKTVQRSLAFLPGEWDTVMAADARASNEFRGRVWNLWEREYFPQHPLIGRGFGFSADAATQLVYQSDPEADRQMVEVGNIHSGFFATVDALGIIGTVFFVIWNLRLLVRCLATVLRRDDPAGFAVRFLSLYLAVTIVSFWAGAATVGTLLPQEFAFAAILLRLQNTAPSRRDPSGDDSRAPRAGHPTLAAA